MSPLEVGIICGAFGLLITFIGYLMQGNFNDLKAGIKNIQDNMVSKENCELQRKACQGNKGEG
jgi:hypothetical protein